MPRDTATGLHRTAEHNPPHETPTGLTIFLTRRERTDVLRVLKHHDTNRRLALLSALSITPDEPSAVPSATTSGRPSR